MKTARMLTILVLVFVLAAASIAHGGQSLTVDNQPEDSIILKVGQTQTVEVVSDDSNPYNAYVGFDDGAVLGDFSHLQTLPAAGDLANVTDYNVPTFYGYFIVAAGSAPPPSAGVHFVFRYEGQQVGETDLKLYDGTLTTVTDSVHITVVPAEMGTAFTYQGHLYDANHVADGLYDFEFELYDAPSDGNQVGGDVNKPEVDVIDGYFTVELDFDGGVFDGNGVWLEIGVRPGDLNDPNVYTTLSPRQRITPTPYAIHAQGAADLTLPYSGTVSSAATAFLVTNNGSGKAIQGIGGNNDGVTGGSDTAGRSGVFGYNDNAAGFGVFGSSINGIGVKGYTYGTSSTAGLFEIQNPGNNNPALKATTDGTGYAGYFEQTGPSNTNGALDVSTAAGRYGAKILNQGGYGSSSWGLHVTSEYTGLLNSTVHGIQSIANNNKWDAYGLQANATSLTEYAYGGRFSANAGGYNAWGIFIDADNTKATSGGYNYGIQLYSDCSNGTAYGIWSDVGVGSGSTSNLYGIYNYGSHGGTAGTSYGMYSRIYGSGGGDSYGIYSEGKKYSSDTAGTAYGGYFIGDNDRAPGQSYGLYTQATGLNGNRYGLYSEVTTSSGSYTNYGLRTYVANNNGYSYGLYADVDPGKYGYGVFVDLDTTTASTNTQCGLYSSVNHQGTGGYVYGVQSYTYSSDTGQNYAGYFRANSNPGDTGSLYGIYASCNNYTSGSKYAVYAYGPSGGYDFYAGGPGVNYGVPSSIRWKSDVRAIDDPLGKLLRLRGVYFNWDAEHGGEHDVGMIAEEVGEILPEIVEYEENGIDATGMDYSLLAPLLVEAVKALKIEVNELQRQNAEKDGVIDTLKQQNDGLEGRLAAVESSITTIAVQLKGGGK